MNDIWEALESTAAMRPTSRNPDPVTPSERDIRNHRDYLMRFLDELDSQMSVGEVRDALENWNA